MADVKHTYVLLPATGQWRKMEMTSDELTTWLTERFGQFEVCTRPVDPMWDIDGEYMLWMAETPRGPPNELSMQIFQQHVQGDLLVTGLSDDDGNAQSVSDAFLEAL